MTDEGWADTPEGIAAFEWVENYVKGLLGAFDDGRLDAARHETDPGFVAEALQGCDVGDAVMERTIELAEQAHDCLNAWPADEGGAWNAVRTIARLWGVQT